MPAKVGGDVGILRIKCQYLPKNRAGTVPVILVREGDGQLLVSHNQLRVEPDCRTVIGDGAVRILDFVPDRGQIEIEYYSSEDLDRIYNIIIREKN